MISMAYQQPPAPDFVEAKKWIGRSIELCRKLVKAENSKNPQPLAMLVVNIIERAKIQENIGITAKDPIKMRQIVEAAQADYKEANKLIADNGVKLMPKKINELRRGLKICKQKIEQIHRLTER